MFMDVYGCLWMFMDVYGDVYYVYIYGNYVIISMIGL